MEEVLSGGNSSSVVRIDDTVHRTSGPWTPAVHTLLRAIREAGILEVPEPLGLDPEGREVLSYLRGTVPQYPMPEWVWTDHVLSEAARLLRRIHDAAAPLAQEPGPWQLPTHEPVETVCLNDVAPYNMVFENEKLTGFIDLDMASPGPRIWDLAYLAYRLVPLGEHEGPGVPAGPDRAARLEALIAAYALDVDASEVMRVAADRLDDLAEHTDRRAAQTGRMDFREHSALYRRDRDAFRAQGHA